MRFTLEIEMGNDAMQGRDDVARALNWVIVEILTTDDQGKIRDDNGNTVGRWEFVPDSDDGCVVGEMDTRDLSWMPER